MTAASFLSLGFRGTIDFFITSFEVSEIVSSGFYFVVSTPFRAKNFQIILKNFEKIDTIVPPTSTEGVRKKSIFFRSGVIVFLIILYILDLFMWGNDSWAGLNNYFAYYVLCTVGITHELQYWHLVSLMQDRVIAFNDKIRSNIERSKVLDNVQDIIKIHDCVCDTVDAINSCFNISASLLILSCYINLVVCPYVLFVMMTSNEINVLNFVYFIWIFLHISRIMVLVNVCHSCEEENQKTNGLILRLLISELGVDMKNEIKVLAKKVCRKKIRFSSYGLSKIDRRLILSFYQYILDDFDAVQL
ncbi:7tm 7 domain containing protein, partial [Asbolus verrucosus]